MVFAQKRHKTQSSLRPNVELQWYGTFENSSVGPQTRAVSADLKAKIGQNWPKSGEQFP